MECEISDQMRGVRLTGVRDRPDAWCDQQLSAASSPRRAKSSVHLLHLQLRHLGLDIGRVAWTVVLLAVPPVPIKYLTECERT